MTRQILVDFIWEEEFRRIWGHLIGTPLAQENLSFIRRLLKEKDKLIEEIEEENEALERREP